jgi:hypothetical protein
VIFALALGCAPVAPPPLFARHIGVGPDAEGTFTVTLAAGIGGADLGGGFGVELRVLWQATEALAIGAGLGTAAGGDDPPPGADVHDVPLAPQNRIFALRGLGRLGARDPDWVSASFGAGVSASLRGQWALTVDAGGAIGDVIGDHVEPSLGLAAALSMPLRQGEGLPTAEQAGVVLPTTTLYLGGSLGVGVRLPDTRNVLSAELGAYRGFATGGARAMVYALSFADRQAITP